MQFLLYVRGLASKPDIYQQPNVVMASLCKKCTLRDYQRFIGELYGIPDDRHFDIWDLVSNVERFTMRALKGIRKGNKEKVAYNLLIALSWQISLMNRLHIDIQDELWKRFPGRCSYCGSMPCSCKAEKLTKRRTIVASGCLSAKNIGDFQAMFELIYPHSGRTLEHAGVHLAEEMGELSEAFLAFKGRHSERDFQNLVSESADYVSCIFGVFNSLEIDLALELSKLFSNNCHKCRKSPCVCNFSIIADFSS